MSGPPAGASSPVHDMRSASAAALQDIQLQQFVNRATLRRDRERVNACREAFGDRYDAIRGLAGSIKQHTLDHLDHYVDQFISAAERAGVKVHFAVDAREANDIVLRIARSGGCTLCVKSKSMVTEETALVPALESAGIETLETDLGEFILQLDHEPPSHIVAPMIHKDRTAVARAFVRELGAPYTEDPPALTAIARAHMRRKFRQADLGISGANFLVAETGSLVLCTNEGNADLSVGVPRVHVAVVGIEKVIPRMEHLSVFLKLLARSATSQPLTVYTSIITGPRKDQAPDGPDEVHIVLLDNGRTRILEEETRELLRCIRCGACLNACPVYRKAGGHAYGAVYCGPIGAVITPLLAGLAAYPDLPQASSLCGACFEACPVKIDIPSQLIRLRRQIVENRLTHPGDRAVMRLWAAILRRPWAYRLASRAMRATLRGVRDGNSGCDPFTDRRWISSAPGPLAAWTSVRDLPTPTSRSFHEWWASRAREPARRGDA